MGSASTSARVASHLTIIFIFCLLLALVPRIHAFEQPLQARQIPGGGSVIGGNSPTASSTTAPASSTAPTSSSSSSPPTSSSSSLTTDSTTSSPSSTSQSTTPASSTPSSTQTPVTPPTGSTSDVVSTSTDTISHDVTTIVTDTPTNTASAPPQQPSSDASNSGSSSLGTGPIIGLSVAGGVAVICIIAFLVWKFTRKRFSDFDDNEAIKWPELNTHSGDSHPLPVHNTGRAGFGDTDSLQDVSRAPSATGYADSMATSSADLYPGHGADPYAVPPLPHLNPNQPYLDDPQTQAFYDPYRGPIPGTFEGADLDTSQGGEAIPMTQMSPNARSRSPGPQMSYDNTGRMSPQQMASRRSPAPQAALGYGEPALPLFSGGPMMDDRSRSPGGLGGAPVAGRRSPGPQAAYDSGYGPR